MSQECFWFGSLLSDLWERLKAQIHNVEILKLLLNALIIVWGDRKKTKSILYLLQQKINYLVNIHYIYLPFNHVSDVLDAFI